MIFIELGRMIRRRRAFGVRLIHPNLEPTSRGSRRSLPAFERRVT
jgi:hypothetical protein